MKKLAIYFSLLILVAFKASTNEHANLTGTSKNSTHYSFGFGVSMMTIDDYIGSNESQFYLIPTPYVYYQSKAVLIDRNAFEGDLFKNKKWHLALDASGSIPVNSDKNEARKGMDDLNWVGELGPSLEYYFYGDSRSNNRTYFDVAIRKAINIDFKSVSDTGWTNQISLKNKFQFNLLGGKATISNTAALLFHSDKYSQYFYSVSKDDVREDRNEFQAKGGFAGIRLSIGSTWRYQDMWVGLFTRYTNLNNTSFENSPLVRTKSNLLIGLSISYIFLEK